MKKELVEDFAKTVFHQDSDKFEEAKKVFRDFYTSQLEELQAGEKAFRNLVSLLLKN